MVTDAEGPEPRQPRRRCPLHDRVEADSRQPSSDRQEAQEQVARRTCRMILGDAITTYEAPVDATADRRARPPGRVLQKSTATTPTPAEHHTHHLWRVRAQRQQTLI